MNNSGFYEELPLESQMSVIYWLFWWIAVEYIWKNSRKIVANKHTCPK